MRRFQVPLLCRLRSIAAHTCRDHFIQCLSVRPSVKFLHFGSHTFLVVRHSYVSQVRHAFLGMLPLCLRHILHIWYNIHRTLWHRTDQLLQRYPHPRQGPKCLMYVNSKVQSHSPSVFHQGNENCFCCGFMSSLVIFQLYSVGMQNL